MENRWRHWIAKCLTTGRSTTYITTELEGRGYSLEEIEFEIAAAKDHPYIKGAVEVYKRDVKGSPTRRTRSDRRDSTADGSTVWIKLDDVALVNPPDAQERTDTTWDLRSIAESLEPSAYSLTNYGLTVTQLDWTDYLPYLKWEPDAETYLNIEASMLIPDSVRLDHYTAGLLDGTPNELSPGHKQTYYSRRRAQAFIDDPDNKGEWTHQHFERLLAMSKKCRSDLKNFHINPYDLSWSVPRPTFTKSRKISEPKKSILFPLQSTGEHINYAWGLNAKATFENTKDQAVWRGANSGPFFQADTDRPNRRQLVELHANSSDHNIGLAYINYEPEKVTEAQTKAWKKGRMGRDEQLLYRYQLVMEGNDAATNLPWVFLSNSVPMMAAPWVETWKMESFTKAGVHYVKLADDFSDLDEKVQWCRDHPDKAREIAMASKLFALQFFDRKRETRLAIAVLERYMDLCKVV